MKVTRDAVVRFHYELRDEAAQTLHSSRDGEPLAILYGHGNVVRGLESALVGHEAGDRFEVVVPPEDGYGLRREGWTQRISKKYLPSRHRLTPGMMVSLSTREGPRQVSVIKVGVKMVDVDMNHPMAGRTLHFDIEIVEVRAAEREEIAHRHVHGPGGHGH